MVFPTFIIILLFRTQLSTQFYVNKNKNLTISIYFKHFYRLFNIDICKKKEHVNNLFKFFIIIKF